MSRSNVLAKVDASNLDAGNAALCSIFGDDPGTVEFGMNASPTGSAPATASVSNCSGMSDTQASQWVAWLAAHPGCDGYQYTGSIDCWAQAQALWGLKQLT